MLLDGQILDALDGKTQRGGVVVIGVALQLQLMQVVQHHQIALVAVACQLNLRPDILHPCRRNVVDIQRQLGQLGFY